MWSKQEGSKEMRGGGPLPSCDLVRRIAVLVDILTAFQPSQKAVFKLLTWTMYLQVHYAARNNVRDGNNDNNEVGTISTNRERRIV